MFVKSNEGQKWKSESSRSVKNYWSNLSLLFKLKWSEIFYALCDFKIAQQLGHLQHHLLINDYCTSLADESPLVISTAVSKLENFLSLFIKKDSNGILNESQVIFQITYFYK